MMVEPQLFIAHQMRQDWMVDRVRPHDEPPRDLVGAMMYIAKAVVDFKVASYILIEMHKKGEL